MTFCLGIRVRDGVVALADTRVTSGNEVIVARKVSTFHQEKRAAFIMTSGLRSVRDKAMTYFDEAWSRPDPALDRLFKVVNLFAAQIRKVSDEDRVALDRGGFQFNLHALIGNRWRTMRNTSCTSSIRKAIRSRWEKGRRTPSSEPQATASRF